jgi:hypothetical protein
MNQKILGLNTSRNIDQIKTIAKINMSHNNLMNEMKHKSSSISLKNDNTQQYEDTMNLFE